MATYWVKYNYNFTVEAGGVESPPRPPLEFLGHQLDYFTSPVVQILADPTPTISFDNISLFYDQFLDYGFSNPAPGEIYRLFVHVSISDSFLVGSAPPPSELLGPTAIAPTLPPVPGGTPSQGVPYNTFAWAQITSTTSALVSITAEQPTGVTEGDTGTKPLRFLLTLDHAAETDFTVEVDFQTGKPSKYVNAVAGVDWISSDPLKTLVAFHKGDTQAKATVQVVGDDLIEPNELFTAQIVSVSDPTVGISPTHNSATATILNDDGGPRSDEAVNGLDQLDPVLTNLLMQDIQAAVGRIEKALDNRVPHLEIDVVLGPAPGAFAAALPVSSKSVVSTDGTSLQLPNALYEKLFPAQGDPNGAGADLKLFLDVNKLIQYYSGDPKFDINGIPHGAVDVTTLLTHEILHGLGFGGADGPWDFLTKSGEFRGSKGIDASIKITTDHSHLFERPTDLMGDGVLQPAPISALDVAILEDLGWGVGKPDWLPHTIAKVQRFFDSATGDHFYTLSPAEADQIRATLPTYHDEGAPWGTPDKGADTVDVFRFFDVATNTHFLTNSVAERDQVMATLPSYHFEGVGFQAYTAPGDGTLTLERFFNTQNHLHHYAASPAEIASILSGGAGPGWVDEGAGFVVHT
jgi:Repeat of unknown function (DUF5648)